MIEQQKIIIEQAWDNRELLNDSKTQESIRYVIEELDKGRLRVSRLGLYAIKTVQNMGTSSF